jgi:hypothetical protein
MGEVAPLALPAWRPFFFLPTPPVSSHEHLGKASSQLEAVRKWESG